MMLNLFLGDEIRNIHYPVLVMGLEEGLKKGLLPSFDKKLVKW